MNCINGFQQWKLLAAGHSKAVDRKQRDQPRSGACVSMDFKNREGHPSLLASPPPLHVSQLSTGNKVFQHTML